MKSATATPAIPIASDLALYEAKEADAAAIYNLINSSRLYLREWLPFIDYSYSVADTEMFLRSVTAPGNMQDKVYTIRYQDQVAGIIGFKTIDRINSKLEIGYWQGEAYQGKGIMIRSCEALLTYAFEHMHMNRIQIKVGIGNAKSSAIPKKLGFSLEGIERDGEWIRDKFIDLEVYSLLKREWEKQKA
ncbi:GCN5 family acetyltransferase [Pontibacter sp. HJ8]